MSPAKTVEPTEMPFGLWTSWDPRSHVLGEGSNPPRETALGGHTYPSLQNSITLGFIPGTRRQGGQRRQWVDDIADWAGLNLPEVMTLANEIR